MGICFGTGPDGHFYECEDRPCPWPRQGGALRRLRRMRDWSLRQLAMQLDVGIVRASDIERGLAEISKAERARLQT
jgi:hypothetical protein